MKHVLFRTVILTLILVLVFGVDAYAASGKQNKQEGRALRGDVDVSRALAYSFADETVRTGGDGSPEGTRVPIGSISFGSAMVSPGVIFGNTWYDWQHNGSMGRMIETGPHSGETGYTIVHMGWMYLPDKKLEARSYAYAAYFSEDHSMSSPAILMTEEEYAGYVNVDVTPDNRAIVGGHNNPPETYIGYAPEFRFQSGPGYPYFPNILRVEDSVMEYAQNDPDEYALWPKFFFQFGTDTVLHVVARISDNDYPAGAIMYYRMVGFEGSPDGEWDYPPYVVDSVQSISHDITGNRTGDRIALTWTASLPYQEPLCDTCSGISFYDGYLIGQMDNDVYYQQSFDQGANFEPRVNLTQCPIGGECYKAFNDLSILIDTYDNLHIIWPACPWPGDLCIYEGGFCWEENWYIDNARLMHWSENVPYVRPIADQVYDIQTELWDSCWAGAWALRIAKPSLSECDNNLYAIWTQFNDPKQDIIDDCAEWGYDSGDPTGAANGDIYLSVSGDYGMTWDYQRNLTGSYTPHCDPKFDDDCQSDNWPSMTRFGRQLGAGEDWSGAVVVDPSGYYYGDHYLDIQYVNDLDAGGIVQAEGSWTDSPLKWFRLPCVDPLPFNPCPFIWPTSFGPPDYTKPGEQLDLDVTIENNGNTVLTYTIDVIYDDGSSGWLSVSGFSGSIPSGLNNTETGTVHLNDGGVLTVPGDYFAHLHFEGNSICFPGDWQVHLWVIDTVPPPMWDSVMTNCLALTTSSNGNMGRAGRGHVNMDYVRDGGDCDTMAYVYMYEGSPFVGRIIDDDTIIVSSMWGSYYYRDEGFFPSVDWIPTKYCEALDAEVFQSGVFSDRDGKIGLEKIHVAPQSDCNYIIEYLRVFSLDGNEHTGLLIGEGIDWDIPTDYLPTDTFQENSVANMGGIDGARNLVYCQGYEAYGAGSDTLYPFNCQWNNARFGGNAFVESYFNGAPFRTYAPRGIVGTNDSLQDYAGWADGALYRELTYTTGFGTTDSIVDISTALAFEIDLTLGATDVYEAVSVLATVKDGNLTDLQTAVDDAKAWYLAHGGMSMFADDDDDGKMDLCESCCIIMGKFYNDGGPFSILDIDDFVEWLLRNPGIVPGPDCPEQLDWGGASGCGVPDGSVDILDLDCIINCLFREGWCFPECP